MTLALVGKENIVIEIDDVAFTFRQINARQRMEFIAKVIEENLENFDAAQDVERLKGMDKRRQSMEIAKENSRFHAKFGTTIDKMMCDSILRVEGTADFYIDEKMHVDDRAQVMSELLDSMTSAVQFQMLRSMFVDRQISAPEAEKKD